MLKQLGLILKAFMYEICMGIQMFLSDGHMTFTKNSELDKCDCKKDK